MAADTSVITTNNNNLSGSRKRALESARWILKGDKLSHINPPQCNLAEFGKKTTDTEFGFMEKRQKGIWKKAQFHVGIRLVKWHVGREILAYVPKFLSPLVEELGRIQYWMSGVLLVQQDFPSLCPLQIPVLYGLPTLE